jgi:propanol-preferring alcohol dehydrogenase
VRRVTTYKAVKAAKVGPSDLVGIVGIGGLGHLGLQYAKIAGCVHRGDRRGRRQARPGEGPGRRLPDQRREARSRGGDARLGGADAIVSTAATPKPLRRVRFRCDRPGRLVLVGLPEDNVFPLPIFETVLRGIQVIGSLVGTREDLAEVFQLHAGGRTRVVLERRELEAGERVLRRRPGRHRPGTARVRSPMRS